MQFQMEDAIAILTRTPATLDRMLRDLPECWLRASEGPDTFTPVDVLGHLIYGELTDWIPRARIILEHGESRAFDPFDRRGGESLIRGRSIGELLDRFAELRAANLGELATMAVNMDAAGRHPELGRVTMGNLLATWAVHDLSHIAQIVRVEARQYREATGPWRKYIPLLG